MSRCDMQGGKSLKYILKTNMAALNLQYAVGLIMNNLVQFSFSVLLAKLQGLLMLWKLNQARALSLAFGILARRKSKIKRKLQQERS